MALPKYRVIADDIVARIHSGRIAPGVRLPSVIVLAREYGVSTITSNRAFQELERLGYVERRERVGTFAASRPAKLTEVFVGIPHGGHDLPLPQSDYLRGILQQTAEDGLRAQLLEVFEAGKGIDEILESPRGKGVVILGFNPVDTIEYRLAEIGVPHVYVGTDRLEEQHCVSENRAEAARALVRALVEDGHRTIAFVGSLERPNHRTARDGYLEGVRELGIGRRLVRDADDTNAREVVVELLGDQSPPDAVVVAGGHLPIAVLPVVLGAARRPTLALFSENSAVLQLKKDAYVAAYSQVQTGRLAVTLLAELARNPATTPQRRYVPFDILRPGSGRR